MNGAWLVAGLLILGFIYLYSHLGPRPHDASRAEGSPGGRERGPGQSDDLPLSPGRSSSPRMYTRSGRSGDLLRAHRPEHTFAVLGPTGAGVEQSAPALATQEGHR